MQDFSGNLRLSQLRKASPQLWLAIANTRLISVTVHVTYRCLLCSLALTWLKERKQMKAPLLTISGNNRPNAFLRKMEISVSSKLKRRTMILNKNIVILKLGFKYQMAFMPVELSFVPKRSVNRLKLSINALVAH